MCAHKCVHVCICIHVNVCVDLWVCACMSVVCVCVCISRPPRQRQEYVQNVKASVCLLITHMPNKLGAI